MSTYIDIEIFSDQHIDIYIQTNCQLLSLLSFIRYGNYCGLGDQAPKPPVDDLDQCCKEHDECFSSVRDTCKVTADR